MAKQISLFTSLLLLCLGVSAQNYSAGPVYSGGPVYDASGGNGSSLSATSSLTIGGTWLFNDAIVSTPRVNTSQTAIMTFHGSGNYTRTTGYVNGYAVASDYTAGFVLPVGQSSYMPLTITTYPGSGAMVTAAWYDARPITNANLADPVSGAPVTYYFLPGYYDISSFRNGIYVKPTLPATATVITRLIGTADGINFTDLGPANSTILLPNSTSYQLRFANSSIALPVTLAAFTAVKQGGSALLGWKVTAEQDVLHYTVERSADNRRFTPVGQLPSLGNTTDERNYSLTDAEPAMGWNYYRLKTTDRGGKLAYSAVRLLNFETAFDIALYPNPATDKAVVSGIKAGLQISLVTMQGQQVRTQKATGPTASLQLSDLPAAAYEVQVRDAAGKLVGSCRVIKE